MKNLYTSHNDANTQLQSANSGNARAYQDSLVASNIGIVQKLALRYLKKFTKTCLEFEDLVSAGEEALVNASREYNSETGVPFQAFAWRYIENSFKKAYRELLPVKLSSQNCHSFKFVCIDDETQGDGLEASLWLQDSYEAEHEELIDAMVNEVRRLNNKEQLFIMEIIYLMAQK